ncbi:MAG: adenosylmethionine--8-amino-7-oxononanoate transaminase [Nitrospirae bacterium]|nr:adenosylmethionine--8-amino-7-oxononanoate transaminase [Nitrospirota bacterium]MCL5284936.1 adenosylmethionine--8-amino-7-oxononanoate transaminase [Nitrospirota bacterium]
MFPDSPAQRHEDLVRRDRSVLWHPFANLALWEREDPPVVASGEGVWLTDVDGHRMLDATASLWVNLLGHRHPALDRALSSQAGQIAHSTFLGATHEGAIRLAERLSALAPAGLTRVFYSDNGSTAVEIAMKLAFLFQRHRRIRQGRRVPATFFSLERGYHGDTLGTVGAGGIDRFHQIFGPLVRPSVTAPAPDCAHCPAGLLRSTCRLECAAMAENLLEAHREDLVAVLVEPLLQAAGGMIVWPAGYLARLARACRNLEIPLIADEVATGFGRTGTLFACEQEGVSPDFMAVGKALTGGYLPLAATLVRESVYEAVREDPGTFYHGHSYTANPLACRVALTTLDCLEAEDLLAAIPEKRERIREAWRSLDGAPFVENLRFLGLIAALDLRKRDGSALIDPVPLTVLREKARKKGLLIRPLGSTLYLIPPLSVTPEEAGLMARLLADTLMEGDRDGLFGRTS